MDENKAVAWLVAWIDNNRSAAVADAESKSDEREAARLCLEDAEDAGFSVAEIKAAAGGDLEAYLLSNL